MTVYLSPVSVVQQFFDNEGNPLANGFLYSYVAESTTPLATFSTIYGDVENSNPIELDSSGRLTTEIWQQEGFAYKYTLADAEDTVVSNLDNVPGVNDVSFAPEESSSIWIDFGVVPIRIDNDSISISGNWSAVTHLNRRMKIVQSSGTVYGTIVASAVVEPSPGQFVTNIDLLLDSGIIVTSIDAGFYSAIDSVGNPVPPSTAIEEDIAVLQGQVTALQAAVASLTTAVSSVLPIGTIAIWPSNTTVPAQWVLCNHQELSRSTYISLFNVIATTFGAGNGSTTFNVPDARGLFIRGFDAGASVDPSRVFGSYQADENKGHTHGGVIRFTGFNGISLNRVTYGTTQWGTGDNTNHNTDSTGTESRPKNLALNYIIYTGV